MIDWVVWKIFLVFLRLSVISFGGVVGILPELERVLVTQNHWLTHDQFMQSYVLAQFVPGPNMVMCAMIGYCIRGWASFTAAFVGIYLMPVLLMSAVCFLYGRYRNVVVVRRLEVALRPLVCGLLVASLVQLWWGQGTSLLPMPFASLVLAVAVTFLGIVLLRSRVGPLCLIFSLGVVTWGVASVL